MMRAIATDPIIAEFAQKIKKLPEVNKIILYGSRARGDFHEWSDYDVLVIISRKNSTIESRIDNIAWNINYKKFVSIIPVVCTESKFRKEIYEPLFINVKREGLVL